MINIEIEDGNILTVRATDLHGIADIEKIERFLKMQKGKQALEIVGTFTDNNTRTKEIHFSSVTLE